MELFPDRAQVRLLSVVRGKYLNADVDGRGVSLTGRRESLNTAWQVHRVTGVDGTHRVLLHSAAYGRYLAISTQAAPYGHRGFRAIQTTYDAPHQADIVWEPVAVEDHIVIMRHPSNRLLRANGRYRFWYNDASVDDATNRSTMTLWKVAAIPARAGPPPLPTNMPFPRVGLRTIVYVRADNLENINMNAQRSLVFAGRSVFNLRTAVANQQGEWHLTLMLCVRAGPYGRFVPLVTNLPGQNIPSFIVVLTTGSPAAQALVHPDVAAR
ncbi:unnamed protein product [Urochloa humidicola]